MKHIFDAFFKRNRAAVLRASVLLALLTMCDSTIPPLTKALANSKDLNGVIMYSLASIAAAIGIGIFHFYANTIKDTLRNNLMLDGRMIMLDKVWKVKDVPEKKKLTQFITEDSTAILNMEVELLFNKFEFVVDLIIGCGAVWIALSFRYMMILLTVCLVMVGLLTLMSKTYRKFATKLDKISAEFKRILLGFAMMFKEYKLNRTGDYAMNEIHQAELLIHEAFIEKRIAKNRFNGFAVAIKCFAPIAIILSIKLFGICSESFEIKTDDALTLVAYFYYIYVPLMIIIKLTEDNSDVTAIKNRVEEIMASDELEDDSDKLEIRGDVETIEFENVKYTVDVKGKPHEILAGISFAINAGERVGLVGASAAGKTTLTRTLYRDIDYTSGRILINGHELTEYQRDSLYRNIFVIAQEAIAFNGTVRENLYVANSKASDEELKDALTKAGLSHLNLNENIEGGAGSRELSGGEKQRLSIARMYLRPEVKIIIMDEATSALDEYTQADVLRAIREFQRQGNRIVIAIAHRLSTVQNSDNIVVLSNGKIIEMGTHDSLLAAKGEYDKLWNAVTSIK